jgi:hypothetical protein
VINKARWSGDGNHYKNIAVKWKWNNNIGTWNYASMTDGLLNSMFNFCGRVSFIVLFCVLLLCEICVTCLLCPIVVRLPPG